MKNIIILAVLLLITATVAKAQLPDLRVVNLSQCDVEVDIYYYTGSSCSLGPRSTQVLSDPISAGSWKDYNQATAIEFEIDVHAQGSPVVTLPTIYATSPGMCPRTTSSSSTTNPSCVCVGSFNTHVVSTNTGTTSPWIVFIYDN